MPQLPNRHFILSGRRSYFKTPLLSKYFLINIIYSLVQIYKINQLKEQKVGKIFLENNFKNIKQILDSFPPRSVPVQDLFPYQFRFTGSYSPVLARSGWAEEERSMGGEWEVTREQNGNWQGAGLQLAMRLLSGRHALLGWPLLSAPFLRIYVVSPVVATEE